MSKLPAHNDVGTLFTRALALHQAGKLREAAMLYEQILALNDRHVNTLTCLGTLHVQMGNREDGISLIRRSLEINPNQPHAHNNLGNALREMSRPDEALASFDRAIALKPDYVEAHYNRGKSLFDLNRIDEALASYDRAIALNLNQSDLHFHRGVALQVRNRHVEALASYDRAIALKLNHPDLHYNRGIALLEQRNLVEALASFDRALKLQPDYVEAYNNRGNVLQEQHRLDAALASYERAIAIKPDHVEANYNRGVTLQKLKRLGEALASYDRALSLQPDYPYLAGIWLHGKMHCCDWSDFEAVCARVTKSIDLGKKASPPFSILAIPASPAQLQHCAQIFIHDRYPGSSMPLCKDARYKHDRIRVGYFSSDFRNHATAHLMTLFFECHDRSRFEIIAFSVGPPAHDAWRQRLEKAFDHFFDVGAHTDKEIAALVREWEIDIAVDLMGHTRYGRMGVFALRPAPVQVNYMYPGSTGADFIDYLIADHTVIPPEHRPSYTEKIVCLPHSYQVNNSTKAISDRSFTRAELGLPDGAFVFCCFNNNFKITPDLFDIWMRLLRAVPGSVLWLLQGNPSAPGNLRREAEVRGVPADRLVFAPTLELTEHLARHRQADLFLDTFYCNAHTTASDALWAGLPVLTCLGGTFAGRVAASLLAAVGLPELIAHSHSEYENRAFDLATHPEMLADLRRKLAENRSTHPLFDTARSARDFEAAYVRMYERSRAGLPPDHIVVDTQADCSAPKR